MHVEAIEQHLQKAAECSTVWAVIREADAKSWVLVLSDEALVDARWDSQCGALEFRAELGQVNDGVQRAALNELVLRCISVIPMPMIHLGADNRYEAVTRSPVDLTDPQALAALLDDLKEQIRFWREVVARPVADVSSSNDLPFV